MPSRNSVFLILERLKDVLFPGYFDPTLLDANNLGHMTANKVNSTIDRLTEEIFKSLVWMDRASKAHDEKKLKSKAEKITFSFMSFIPELRTILTADIKAIFAGDPAAQSEPEIILAYPGFHAITVYRIAHFFFRAGVPLIPRLMTEIIHNETGIDIHPGAKIGKSFCIDHGTGIVIGETAEIGNYVKLYQGVTIGALSVSKSMMSAKRHPTLEDHVTVYARTTILGGATIIGEKCIIGGNVWLTDSVPAGTKVYAASDHNRIPPKKSMGKKT
ncbi:MAG: serine O-acetyltransferase [Candidatus Marinamargulisbacteria bacterium]